MIVCQELKFSSTFQDGIMLQVGCISPLMIVQVAEIVSFSNMTETVFNILYHDFQQKSDGGSDVSGKHFPQDS